MRLASLFLLLVSSSISQVQGQGDALVQPPVLESTNGLLDIELHLEYATIEGPFFTLTNTRLYNGIIPGPTLRVNAGDNLRIEFENELEAQPNTIFPMNEFSKCDYSNLHFHGGHVSGELPSDDVRLIVSPGDSYQYDTTFPSSHMGGTHWIHPHLHGSSALQTAGGAGLTLIVNDPPGSIPSQVEDATEAILFVHHMELTALSDVITAHNDQKMTVSVDPGASPDFRLVNGQYQPVLTMQPGEWQRWRIVMAGWLIEELDFQIDSSACEMHLLSRDGIYIRDFPRTVSVLPIPAGGRADVMVRCSNAGIYNVLDYSGTTLMTLSVTGDTVSSSDLAAWTPTYPDYLADLRNTPADAGCACPTNFQFCRNGRRELQFGGGGSVVNEGPFCVNGLLFEEHTYIHRMKHGAVIERDLVETIKHPYHQHVYPVQLISSGTITEASHVDYYKPGDWQDVIQIAARNAIVRYKAEGHTGLVMLHCHILTHEDRGTMAMELVVDGEECTCDPFVIDPASVSPPPTPEPPSLAPSQPSVAEPTAAPIKRRKVPLENKNEAKMAYLADRGGAGSSYVRRVLKGFKG